MKVSLWLTAKVDGTKAKTYTVFKGANQKAAALSERFET